MCCVPLLPLLANAVRNCVLFVQQDIADRVITLIQGAMQELKVGEPHLHQTDIGPVIDEKPNRNCWRTLNT